MFEQYCPECGSFSDMFVGGALGGLLALGIAASLLLVVGLYVYTSYTWMTIARKQKYKNAWLAWIPIANFAMILQLGNFHWAWVFLILVPVLGWIALFVLGIIATWRIFEARKYPGWFSLSMVIPKVGGILYLIAIGFVAFKDRKKPMKF
jgi:uncharacterized membrane protein YhaH (DUF805 family)